MGDADCTEAHSNMGDVMMNMLLGIFPASQKDVSILTSIYVIYHQSIYVTASFESLKFYLIQ